MSPRQSSERWVGNFHTPPLDPEITRFHERTFSESSLSSADAMGYRRLLDALDANPQNGFNKLLQRCAKSRTAHFNFSFDDDCRAGLTLVRLHARRTWLCWLSTFLARVRRAREYDRVQPRPQPPILGAQQLVDAGLEPEKIFADSLAHAKALDYFRNSVYNFIEAPYTETALSQVQIRGVKETFGLVTFIGYVGRLAATDRTAPHRARVVRRVLERVGRHLASLRTFARRGHCRTQQFRLLVRVRISAETCALPRAKDAFPTDRQIKRSTRHAAEALIGASLRRNSYSNE